MFFPPFHLFSPLPPVHPTISKCGLTLTRTIDSLKKKKKKSRENNEPEPAAKKTKGNTMRIVDEALATVEGNWHLMAFADRVYCRHKLNYNKLELEALYVGG
jgi:hypothetical protein